MKKIITIILAAFLICGAAVPALADGGGMASYVKPPREQLESLGPDLEALLALYLEESYYQLDRDEAIATMLRSALQYYPWLYGYLADALLGAMDPYAGYYPASGGMPSVLIGPNEYWGYGIVIEASYKVGKRGFGTAVGKVYPGSPADEAGVKPGDVFLRMNGYDVSSLGQNAVMDLFDASGQSVTLTLVRGGKEIEFHLERGPVYVEPFEFKIVDEKAKIAYVSISNFADEDMVEPFYDKLFALKVGGYNKLIIDLRGNPGGEMYAMLEMIDLFTPQRGKLISTLLTAGGKSEEFYSTGRGFEFELTLLTDGSTASAAEIFAAALRDLRGASVVGRTTHGKFIGQVYCLLENGDVAAITFGEFISPNGTAYNRLGVEPEASIGPKTETDTFTGTLGILNFVNAASIKRGTKNAACRALNERLARIGYLDPAAVTDECTALTIEAVMVLQKCAGLPVGEKYINYAFVSFIDSYASYAATRKYAAGDPQLDCAIVCAREGVAAAVEYAKNAGK